MFKKVHVFRVKPGQELLSKIADYCAEHGISSGVIIGIIGSVERAQLNFLNGGLSVSVERETRLELATTCLEGRDSTN